MTSHVKVRSRVLLGNASIERQCAVRAIVAVVLSSIIVVARADNAASAAGPPVPLGGLLALFAADGNERITGECTLKRPRLLSCAFVDVRLLTPDLEEIARNEQKLADELAAHGAVNDGDIRQTKRELADYPRMMKRLLTANGARVGPKMRHHLTELARASRRGDVATLARLQLDLHRRTCRLSAFTFNLDFTPLGASKWISTVGPAGVCGIKKVYELVPTDPGDNTLWQLSDTLAAIAKTTGACKWHDKALNKPEVWTTNAGPFGGFELPCDFVQ